MVEYIDRLLARSILYDADAITFDGLGILEKIPAADVGPVKHGEWIIPKRDNEQVYCSVCNWHVYGDLFTPYCPGCGAKMSREVKT